jgi:uncharacterized pyridoxal phosphate-containing UPF0001 family protein
MRWRLLPSTPSLLPHSYNAPSIKILDSFIAAKIRTPEEVLEAVQAGMGMTNSYQVALEEGANIIRIGTKIFGERARSL